MANDLRFISTLDHSQFDKGISESTAEIRKIAEESNQASKGIKGMFDSPEMKEARANFAGVEQSVSKFVAAMSRELPMKKELRSTQVAASELERIWRSLNEGQKSSAAGKALRKNIDELIKRGGDLKDVIGDVNSAMKFEASDTAKLDAIIGGVQTLTAVAQAAAGALTLMGMSQEDAAKVQKDLIAIMSVVNALQVIQNALQKESALMMGVAAIKAKLLNSALLANPIFKIVAIGGAVIGFLSALIGSSNKAADAAKKHAEAEKEANKEIDARKKAVEMMGDSVASSVSKQLANYTYLQQKWKECGNDIAAQQKFLSDYRTELDATGFSVKSVYDAQNILVDQAPDVIDMYYALAEAAAAAAVAEDAFKRKLERKYKGTVENGGKYYAAPNKFSDLTKEEQDFLGSGFSSSIYYNTSMTGSPTTLTGEGKKAINKYRENRAKQLRQQLDEQDDAIIKEAINIRERQEKTSATLKGKIRTPYTGGKNGTTTSKSTTKKKEEPTTPLSYDWYSEKIKQLEDLANKTADVAERAKLLNSAELWAWVRDVKFGEATEEVEGFGKAIQGVAIDIQSAVEGIDFKGIHERIMAPINAAKDAIDSLKEKVATSQEGIRAMGNLMSGMGKIVGGSAGDWLSWSASVMSAVAQALPEIAKLFPALFSKAAAEAMAQNSAMGPFGWISGLAAMASIIAAMATLPKFATGGIVGGTSYGGDRQLVRVNSGEMILNHQQQAQLWNAISSGSVGGGEVQFRIEGQQLVGVLNNYNSKYRKVR